MRLSKILYTIDKQTKSLYFEIMSFHHNRDYKSPVIDGLFLKYQLMVAFKHRIDRVNPHKNVGIPL